MTDNLECLEQEASDGAIKQVARRFMTADGSEHQLKKYKIKGHREFTQP